MKTDWDDAELNPPGLKLMDTPAPKNVTVSVTARALAHFKDKDGNSYMSAFVEDRTRVFVAGEHGYQEVENPETQFIVLRMTEEAIKERGK